MTLQRIKISDHFASLLDFGIKTCELRLDDRDYQTGDTLAFFDGKGNRRFRLDDRKVTHVLKNIEGLTPGWCVLSLNDPHADALRRRTEQAELAAESQRRTIAALRGQITKLRNAAKAVQS